MSQRRTLVVAALVVRDGNVLLSKRRPDQAMPNLWELPGGKIEPGESPQEALARELHEELGCTARVGEVFDVVFHAYEDFDLYMLVYACELSGEEPSAIQVAEVKWVPAAELPNMELLPADFALAKRLALDLAH